MRCVAPRLARRWTIVGAVLAACMVGLAANAPDSANAPQDDRQEDKAEPKLLTTLNYGGGEISSVGGALQSTGFTLAALSAPDEKPARFAVSAAYLRDKPLGQLSVSGVAKDGKYLAANSCSSAAASGAEVGVVTVVCELDAPASSIKKLIVLESPRE